MTDRQTLAVARAICKADGFDPDGVCTIQNDIPREQWEPFIVHAQAAIAASDAQYVPGLIEALREIRDTTPMVAQRQYLDKVLDSLPEDLKP